jgi:AraC-like DNA-binding protein
MLLKDFLPSPILREYVKYFGIVHLSFSEKENIPVKVYTPKPGDSIEFFLREPEFVSYPEDNKKHKRSSPIIVGQYSLVTNRYVGNEFLFLNINLQPGAFYRLTGIPSYKLTNTYIDAEAVFSKEIRLINEQLKIARSYTEIITLAESFILMLIKQSKKDAHRIDMAAKILLQSTDHISMDWLAKESCLSSRQFERKFKERMGVSPALLARLARFDKAFKMKNAAPEKDWLSIAVQCGYHDYQHLVRDYKDFTGLTPTAFFQTDNQAPERIFGLHE